MVRQAVPAVDSSDTQEVPSCSRDSLELVQLEGMTLSDSSLRQAAPLAGP